MVRKLKHHEQKLLKKTDFITYKQDNGHRDHNVIRRYMIQKPEDYNKYNRLCGVSALWPMMAHKLGRLIKPLAVTAPACPPALAHAPGE